MFHKKGNPRFSIVNTTIRCLSALSQTKHISQEERIKLLEQCDILNRNWRGSRKRAKRVSKIQRRRQRRRERQRQRRAEKKQKAEIRKLTGIRNPETNLWSLARTNPSSKRSQLHYRNLSGVLVPQSFLSASRCYVCHEQFQDVHHFYDQLCIPCGDMHYSKRSQSADLSGYVALITGGRSEIGLQVALFLLRANCQTVIVTTRFPEAMKQDFALQIDYDDWKHALDVQGLNLRHVYHVEQFCKELQKKYSSIDIIIHNAAQTIAQSKEAYLGLLKQEDRNLVDGDDSDCRCELDQETPSFDYVPFPELQIRKCGENFSDPVSFQTLKTTLGLDIDEVDFDENSDNNSDASNSSFSFDLPNFQSYEAILNTQEAFLQNSINSVHPDNHDDDDEEEEDIEVDFSDSSSIEEETKKQAEVLENDQTNTRNQHKNSWQFQCDEVSTKEIQSVMTINAIVPFLFNGWLKPLLLKSTNCYQFIIHVTSKEGQFECRHKTSRHPHTNMAKAALNMHTRTSAPEFLRDGILMVSVDPGWITNRNPLPLEESQRETQQNLPPFDKIDAAARIVDPIFMALNYDQCYSGVFLQNYEPSHW